MRIAADPEAPAASAALQEVLDYARAQGTTGFLAIRDRRVLAERNWQPPAPAAGEGPKDSHDFSAFVYGAGADGALLEDVASLQKSFIALLAAIAVDHGLLEVERPVSDYLGSGWSKASADRQGRIRVLDLLTMTSGLDVQFGYAAPAGSVFLYNTPVYAELKRVLAAASHRSLEDLTREWVTEPLGMAETAWRLRPPALADIGNPTALVTNPRDLARLGQMVLDGGCAADGRRIVSEAQLRAMFVPTPANPAYGRLWWLNGSGFSIRPLDRRVEGPLIPSAPADLIAGLGAMDRKLYVVPSLKLVAVRTGPAAPDKDFDEQLWSRLARWLG